MGKRHKDRARDGERFVALPHIVLDAPSYIALSFSARGFLLDIARQYDGTNNGKLVICDKAMAPRGWTSSATIHKAKRDLLEGGFLCETRKGHKPNKTSWFAVTWLTFDWTSEMDIQRSGFVRSAYLQQNRTP